MTKRIKEIHGERPVGLTDEDYQAILDAEEGIFFLTKPEMSEVEKRQAEQKIRRVDKGEFPDMQMYEVDGPVDEHIIKVIGAKTGRMSNLNPDLSVIPGREFTRKRFIGIAEVNEEPMDSESMMRLT